MLNSQEIKAKLTAIRPTLFARYPICHLALFGSVARNEARPGSDIDLLVEFSEPIGFRFFELAKELESYLGQPVDLVSRNGIKPAYFAEIEAELLDV